MARPRLPLDPFSTIDAAHPWSVPASLPHSPPQVILVLGEPRPSDLLPLLTSPHLASSLLLLATHVHPRIPALPPNAPGPAVRVLRLPAPLAVHDSGALRLVSLFERAARVARLWRYSSQSTSTAHCPRIIQLAEEVPGGQFTLVEPFVYAAPAPQNDVHVPPTTTTAGQAPPHPTPTPHTSNQHINLSADPKYPSPAPSIVSYPSYASTSTSASTSRPPSTYAPSSTSLPKKQHRTQSALRKLIKHDSSPNSHAYNNSNMRTFDALINFLPANLPDKALLKHAVLVSTLSSQYLTVPPSTPSALHASSYAAHSRAGESIPRPLSKTFSFASFTISPSSAPSSSLSSTPLESTPETSPCPSPPPPLAPADPLPHEKLTDGFTSSGSGVHKVKSKRSSSRMSVLSLSGILRLSTPAPAVPPIPPSASASSSSPSLASDSPSRRQSTIHSASNSRNTATSHYTSPHPHGDKPKNAHLVHVLPAGWVAEEVRAEAEALRLQERERRRRQTHAYAPVLSSGLRPLPVGDEDGPRASTRPTLATRQLQGHSSSYEHVGGLGGGMSGKRSSSVPLLSNAGVQGQGQQQRRRAEKPKLVQSVEQFLLAFAYPLGSVAPPSPAPARYPSLTTSNYISSPGKGKERARPASAYLASGSEEASKGDKRASYLSTSGSSASIGALAQAQAETTAQSQSKPVPYLVAPDVWGAEVRGTRRSRNPHHLDDASTEREMTIGEIVLLGALDFDHELAGGRGGGVGRTGGGIGNGGNGSGRAWVGAVDDVQVTVVLEDSRDHEEAREREEERRANWGNGLETEVGLGLEAKGKEEGEEEEEEEDQRRKDSERKDGERKRRSSHHHHHHQHHHYGHGLPTPPETSSSDEGDEVDDGECEEEFHTPVQSPASIPSPVRERLEDSTRPAPRLQTSGSTQIQGQGQGQGQASAQASPTRSPTKSHTAVAHPIPRPPPLVAGSATSRTGRRVSGSVDGYEGELEEYTGPGSVRSQRSTSSSAGSTVQRQGQERQGKHETPTPTITLSAPSPALSGSFARSQVRGHGHVHVRGQRPSGSGSGSLPSAARSAIEVHLGSRHHDTDHEKASSRKEARRRSVVSLVVPGTRGAWESGSGKKRGDGHGGSGHGYAGSGFGAVLRKLGIRWGEGGKERERERESVGGGMGMGGKGQEVAG